MALGPILAGVVGVGTQSGNGVAVVEFGRFGAGWEVCGYEVIERESEDGR